jgi:hypothetical protein
VKGLVEAGTHDKAFLDFAENKYKMKALYCESYVGENVGYGTSEYSLFPKEEYWITFQLDLKGYDPKIFLFRYQKCTLT